MTVWRLNTERLKRFGKTPVKMVETTFGRGDITKESEEMQIEALKEGTRAEMYGGDIISAVIP